MDQAQRDIVTRARKMALAGTGKAELCAITGVTQDAPDEAVRSEALSEAQRLLLEMVVIAERLG